MGPALPRATVGRLVVHTDRAGGRATGRQVAARVRTATIEPAHLPPAAVLVVREVATTVRDLDPVTATGRDRALEEAVCDQLERCLATAARPVGGIVPSAAAAVVFLDEAERVACALRCLLRGGALPWWARTPHRPSGPVALLGDDPRLLPAVVDHLGAGDLDGGGDIPRLARALPGPAATALVAELARAFALPTAPPATSAARPLPSVLAAPLDRLATTPGVAIPAAVLVVVAAALVRAPDVCRTPAVAALLADPMGAPVTRASPTGTAADPSATDPVRATPPPDGGTAGSGHGRTSGGLHPTGRRTPSRTRGHGRRRADPDAASAATGDVTPTSGNDRDSGVAPTRPLHPPEGHPTGSRARSELPAPGRDAVLPTGIEAASTSGHRPGVRTAVAGVFYLVNLLEDLGWPEPAGRDGYGEGGWARLERLARGLLGTGSEAGASVARDPLWAVLADLAGRSPDRALAPEDDETLEEVRASLGQVLDLPADDAVAELRVDGWVQHGRTHVDVLLPLQAISLVVRLAGLDRTPGWVPELGRVITLTFEEP